MNDDIRSDDGTVMLKRNRRGRVQRTPEQRAVILDEFDRCGLSGPAFARATGVSYPTLVSWIQKRKHAESAHFRRSIPQGDRDVCFIPAVSSGHSKAQPIEVRLFGSASVQVTSPEQARLVALLLRELQSGGAVC